MLSELNVDEIVKEFENYQRMAEKMMRDMSVQISVLEKKLDSFANIMEMSKFINAYINDEDLLPLINDMLVGVLGVTYSTIYIVQEGKMHIKTSNIPIEERLTEKDHLIKLQNSEAFILNSESPIFNSTSELPGICSVIGIPIQINKQLFGFILVEHTVCDFFNKDHLTFMNSLANHIAIALENNILYKKINDNANRDPLTGLFNRRYFFSNLENALLNDSAASYAIVMIDIDDFKKCNDTYGHQYGDEVLKSTAKLIVDNTREKDITARYGGEEIIVYLYNVSDRNIVFDLMEKIRQKISENIIEYEGIKGSITASFGIAINEGNRVPLTKIIGVADDKLYEAKHTGKNKIVI